MRHSYFTRRINAIDTCTRSRWSTPIIYRCTNNRAFSVFCNIPTYSEVRSDLQQTDEIVDRSTCWWLTAASFKAEPIIWQHSNAKPMIVDNQHQKTLTRKTTANLPHENRLFWYVTAFCDSAASYRPCWQRHQNCRKSLRKTSSCNREKVRTIYCALSRIPPKSEQDWTSNTLSIECVDAIVGMYSEALRWIHKYAWHNDERASKFHISRQKPKQHQTAQPYGFYSSTAY